MRHLTDLVFDNFTKKLNNCLVPKKNVRKPVFIWNSLKINLSAKTRSEI